MQMTQEKISQLQMVAIWRVCDPLPVGPIGQQAFGNKSSHDDVTHISLFIIVHICEYFPIHLVFAEIDYVL